MSLTNPDKIVTEERLSEFYGQILPYLGGASNTLVGGGYAPIGTVIAFMGTIAPRDFLACDGTVYNITAYQELANFIEDQFGSINYFGGNGTTTFAVPDLRGEFLRGTGTNSHTKQGNGANVGEHQDGTEHTNLYDYGNTMGLIVYGNASSDYNALVRKIDSKVRDETHYSYVNVAKASQTGSAAAFTSRPTNTSILYCIKAVSDGYSTDEKVVSTWIDGKPVYQRVININAGAGVVLTSNTWVDSGVTISNLDKIVGSGIAIDTTATGGHYLDYPVWVNAYANGQLRILQTRNIEMNMYYLIVQYTKTTD